MIELLAALSASAAAGIRIALPLLVIGILQGENLWVRVPILSGIPPPIVLGVLTSWSLVELFASKNLLGQRLLQLIQLLFSPIAGAMMGIGVVGSHNLPVWLIWIIGVVGSSLALVLQLVQVGWFYRWRGLPLWVVFVQDALCTLLVFMAINAPQPGGLIALILLWLAVHFSNEWRHSHQQRYSLLEERRRL